MLILISSISPAILTELPVQLNRMLSFSRSRVMARVVSKSSSKQNRACLSLARYLLKLRIVKEKELLISASIT